MSLRLKDLINRKKIRNEKLLSIFVTAGFPEREATVEVVITLAEAGVDFIELGIPFSDPLADGPVIQEASDKAISNGMNLPEVLRTVSAIRQKSDIPILLMGYLNPVYRMGLDNFILQASQAGADGLIIPDWPLEEGRKFNELLRQSNLDLIHMIAPNTPAERLKLIDAESSAFIYAVAYTGITGQESKQDSGTSEFLSYIHRNLQHPIMIGFGIKNKEDYDYYTQFADGVIIGSAFIKLLQNTGQRQRKNAIQNFIREIRGIPGLVSKENG